MRIGGVVQRRDDALEVLDDAGSVSVRDRGRVGVERLDLDLEAGVGRGEHAEALALVVRDPVLPAAGGHPEAVDQDDRVGRGAHGIPSAGRVLGPHLRAARSRWEDMISFDATWCALRLRSRQRYRGRRRCS